MTSAELRPAARSRGFAVSLLAVPEILLWLTVPCVFGLFAVALGQDANWDLRNYHWYNAYAFATGRIWFDMAAAQTPSFYNPVLDVPVWALAQVLPGRAVGFALGAAHGVAVMMIAALGTAVLPIPAPGRRRAAALGLALAGGLGGGAIGELGTTYYDNVLCIGIAGALLALAAAQGSDRGADRTGTAARLGLLALAGLLAGATGGLKLPAACWPAGIGLAALLVPPPGTSRPAAALAAGLGIAAGMALTAGHWM